MSPRPRLRVRRPHSAALPAALLVLLVAGSVWVIVQTGDLPPPADTGAARASEPPAAPATTAGSLKFADDGVALPRNAGSLRFAVMGDTGRGDRAQYDTANEMAHWRERFAFTFVLMLGDNIYAAGTPQEYAARFERPYKALLDAGVVFHAVIGNHDPPGEADYPPFNMNGHRYYSFVEEEGPLPIGKHQIAFFAIDNVNLDAQQVDWLRRELAASSAEWKICFFHHPLYTSGRYSLSAASLRQILEPIFIQYGVQVGLNGHEHFYERIVPAHGVQYFTSGAGGAVRPGGLRHTAWTASGFDRDNHFMLMEISGDTLYFQVISRTGQTIDVGRIDRAAKRPPVPASWK
jgi:hypothetical protein